MIRLDAQYLYGDRSFEVTDMLTRAGHQAWFVGGCVRNAMMGLPVSDIDITTDAPPDRVMELARDAGLRAVPTGIDHGTVTILSGDTPFEVTTFRRDVGTDGRHATVAFSDSIEDDAARRDFTMNALYVAPDGTLADPVGGLPDLDARRVRFIGDPARRIEEDYLRILRFFRFHAIYGDPAGGIDPEGLAACANHVEGLCRLSRERIGAEMKKLLGATDPAPALASMEACGALHMILPGASSATVTVLVHLEADVPSDPIRRLAALGGDAPAERFRLSNAEARRLARLRDTARGEWPLPEIGFRLGFEDGLDAALVRAALVQRPMTAEEIATLRHAAEQRFPVTARDLMPGLSGAALGRRLKHLEARWIASGFRLSKDALLDEVPD